MTRPTPPEACHLSVHRQVALSDLPQQHVNLELHHRLREPVYYRIIYMRYEPSTNTLDIENGHGSDFSLFGLTVVWFPSPGQRQLAGRQRPKYRQLLGRRASMPHRPATGRAHPFVLDLLTEEPMSLISGVAWAASQHFLVVAAERRTLSLAWSPSTRVLTWYAVEGDLPLWEADAATDRRPARLSYRSFFLRRCAC